MKVLFVSLTDDELDMMSTWKMMARFYCYVVYRSNRPGLVSTAWGMNAKSRLMGCQMPFLRDSRIHIMRLKVCIELLR